MDIYKKLEKKRKYIITEISDIEIALGQVRKNLPESCSIPSCISCEKEQECLFLYKSYNSMKKQINKISKLVCQLFNE